MTHQFYKIQVTHRQLSVYSELYQLSLVWHLCYILFECGRDTINKCGNYNL